MDETLVGADGPMAAAITPDPTERQRRILEAALRLFAERGYLSTTMADIGAEVGIRGPSLYKHVSSKQEMLARLMMGTMEELLRRHTDAVSSASDAATALRRATEAHVRFHVRHQAEAFIGNRELNNLEEPNRSEVVERRRQYEGSFRDLIARGVEEGTLRVKSVKLAAYSLLDMGVGVAVWFRDDGEFSEDEITYHYGDLAMRMVGHVGSDR